MVPDLTLEPGSVVQLDPELCKNRMLGACFLTVTEVRDWGLIGYVQAFGTDGEIGGQAFYRAEWFEVELVGMAVFIRQEDGI